MVIAIAEVVHGDMRVLQPDLALADQRVGAAQLGFPVANRLNLRSHQRDAGLDGALDGIVVIGLAIDVDDFHRLLIQNGFGRLFLRLLSHNKEHSFADVYLLNGFGVFNRYSACVGQDAPLDITEI